MTRAAETQKYWLTVKEAAEYLGVSTDLVYDGVARGELPALRLGRTIRVSLKTLEKP